MSDFLKQDIFFFVTTIAVVILTIFLAIAVFYVVRILRDLKYISSKAKTESDLIAEDLHELRTNVKQEGAKLKFFSKFVASLFKRHKK
jgi:hypothetical protein